MTDHTSMPLFHTVPGHTVPGAQAPLGTTGALSTGSAMDRPLVRTPWRRVALGGGLAVFLSVLTGGGAYVFSRQDVVTVSRPSVQIAPAVEGPFAEQLKVQAAVLPSEEIYLDSETGGTVSEILVADGSAVTAGQVLLKLSNIDILLSVLTLEAQVAERITAMRNLELALERNRTEHAEAILRLEDEATRRRRDLARKQTLRNHNVGTLQDLEKAEDDVRLQNALLALERQRSRTELDMQTRQMDEMREVQDHLLRNLALARSGMERLTIRAPITGTFASLNAIQGEYKTKGARIGRIFRMDSVIARAQTDEYHYPRLRVGQTAALDWNGHVHTLRVARINPEIKDRQFTLDLVFDGEAPAGLAAGQSVPISVHFGTGSRTAVTVESGPFLADTGGTWAFVVDRDGTGAERRPLRIGWRQGDRIEVLDGLAPGDRIVTSSYRGFINANRLVLE